MNSKYNFIINKWYNYYKKKHNILTEDDKLHLNSIKETMVRVKTVDSLRYMADLYYFALDVLENNYDKSIKMESNGYTETEFTKHDLEETIDENYIQFKIGVIMLREGMNIQTYTKGKIIRFLNRSEMNKEVFCKIIGYLKYVWEYGKVG